MAHVQVAETTQQEGERLWRSQLTGQEESRQRRFTLPARSRYDCSFFVEDCTKTADGCTAAAAEPTRAPSQAEPAGAPSQAGVLPAAPPPPSNGDAPSEEACTSSPEEACVHKDACVHTMVHTMDDQAFDLILCRYSIFLYCDDAAACTALRRIVSRLAPEGDLLHHTTPMCTIPTHTRAPPLSADLLRTRAPWCGTQQASSSWAAPTPCPRAPPPSWASSRYSRPSLVATRGGASARAPPRRSLPHATRPITPQRCCRRCPASLAARPHGSRSRGSTCGSERRHPPPRPERSRGTRAGGAAPPPPPRRCRATPRSSLRAASASCGRCSACPRASSQRSLGY